MSEKFSQSTPEYLALPLSRVGKEKRAEFLTSREVFLTSLREKKTFEQVVLSIEHHAQKLRFRKDSFILNDHEELVTVAELTKALREMEVAFHTYSEQFTKDNTQDYEIYIPDVIASINGLKETSLQLAQIRLESSLSYRADHTIPVGENGEQINIHTIPSREGQKANPTLIVPGFRSGPNSFEEFALDVSSSGRQTSVLDVEATPKTIDETVDVPEGTPPLLSAHTTAVSTGLRHVHETTGEKIDLVGHSLGAMSSTLAARANPEMVRSLTLVNPAGMPGNLAKYPKLARLINVGWMRKPKEAAQQKRLGKRDSATRIRQEVDEKERQTKIASEDKGTDIQVGAIVTGFSIAPYLEELISKGVKVTIIITSEDYMFPAKDIKSEAEKHNVGESIVEESGPHNSLKYEPGKVAATVNAILD